MVRTSQNEGLPGAYMYLCSLYGGSHKSGAAISIPICYHRHCKTPEKLPLTLNPNFEVLGRALQNGYCLPRSLTYAVQGLGFRVEGPFPDVLEPEALSPEDGALAFGRSQNHESLFELFTRLLFEGAKLEDPPILRHGPCLTCDNLPNGSPFVEANTYRIYSYSSSGGSSCIRISYAFLVARPQRDGTSLGSPQALCFTSFKAVVYMW